MHLSGLYAYARAETLTRLVCCDDPRRFTLRLSGIRIFLNVQSKSRPDRFCGTVGLATLLILSSLREIAVLALQFSLVLPLS